jgi:stage III sporulation protein SpoIIIAA
MTEKQMVEKRITDDIHVLKRVLPMHITYAIEELGHENDLLEIVLDLGRLPSARYVDGEIDLSEREVTRQDIDSMTGRIGIFDADNRAGMERTLHRISAIRNRKNEIVGLTIRIGRAVYGTIDIIEELIKSGKNILMLGAPGVGKTTMLREAARVLAEDKRVVIVDTSNEIGGDGDVPHPAVGKARRMQVSHPERQHEVMIEAVENHNPEVIVIDEIGRELEAQAARTIAERGVQLIGTAHGNTLENLMLNPTLSDLVGGIESVTLSDEEARRRGTQKVVLERRSPPTFNILVELKSRDLMVIHEDVSTDVDTLLRGRNVPVEIRTRDESGTIKRERGIMETADSRIAKSESFTGSYNGGDDRPNRHERGNKHDKHDKRANGNHNSDAPHTQYSEARPQMRMVKGYPELSEDKAEVIPTPVERERMKTLAVYAYGVAKQRLLQAAKRLNVPLDVTENFGQANAVVTMKTYYRTRPKQIVDAERQGMPIYVLRANTVSQMENFLIDVFKLQERTHDPFGLAVQEMETAIARIREGEEMVALAPQVPHIRKHQHKMAQDADVHAKSVGEEPERHLRLYRDESA